MTKTKLAVEQGKCRTRFALETASKKALKEAQIWEEKEQRKLRKKARKKKAEDALVARLKEKYSRNKDTKTYIIRGQKTGMLKIGLSAWPEDRRASLQCGSPDILELVYVFKSNIEKELHKRFSESRKHREWFYPSVELLDFIDSLACSEVHIKSHSPIPAMENMAATI